MARVDTIWRRRWDGLREDIIGRRVEIESQLRSRRSQLDDYDQYKIQALAQVLSKLQAFAEEYFTYFLTIPDAEFLPKYPREHVLMTILEQIGNDMEVLSRIADNYFTLTGTQTLRTADYLAHEALQLGKNLGWLNNIDVQVERPVIFSYFQKSVSIRVIPYANVLLVGIPSTTIRTPEDLLAIPHEVGHYLYWQANTNGFMDSVMVRVTGEPILYKPAWCFRWLEEIFADMYSAAVGGAMVGLSFQDLMLQHLPQKMFVDDQDHPTPNLRPYLYAKVINKVGLKESARELYERWGNIMSGMNKTILDDGQQYDRVYFSDRDPLPVFDEKVGMMSEGVGLDDLDSAEPPHPIDAAVQWMAGLFWDRSVNHEPDPDKSMSDIVQENNSEVWQSAVNKIEKRIGDRTNTSDEELRSIINNVTVNDFINNLKTDDYIEQVDQFEIRGPSPKDIMFYRKIYSNLGDMPDWFHVWLAGGWNTEGPKCEGGSSVC